MSKKVIVYYSLTNHTKEAAEWIANKIGADLVRLELVKDLPEHQGKKYMIGGMQASMGMKPPIHKISADLSAYDEIILGTPVWASKCAPAINTFLEDKAVCAKVKSVFTFSGGGDNDKCIKGLKKKLPNLKNTVALADKKYDNAGNNEAKLNGFVETMING